MSRYDFSSPRLFVDMPLTLEENIELSHDHINYLLNVLRLKTDNTVLLFNGRDGEWLAKLTTATRKHCVLRLISQTRQQPLSSELWYAFAPIKSARLDYMVQKAVEMGVTKLIPVLTRRTQVTRLNLERMRANVIEAAEQCGILNIAEVEDEMKLERFIACWSERLGTSQTSLIFCDEDAEVKDPVASLRALPSNTSICLLVGPEGGFDPLERRMISELPDAMAVSLGPRILRADTAAVAALALVQAAIGDWVG